MSDGRSRDHWQHTASLLAMLHNTVPGLKAGDMKEASFFYPFDKPQDEDIEVGIDALKVFLQVPAA